MEDNGTQGEWRWKMANDRSRRDKIRKKPPANDSSVVIYRQKKPNRRRQKAIKKRWSVRPDVNLAMLPPKKQCRIIWAGIFLLFGVILAIGGLVVLFILKDLTTLVWAIGIGVLVLGIILFLVSLVFLLCVCCFKTSSRYKEYKAQFKGGDICDIMEVLGQLQTKGDPVTESKNTLISNADNISSVTHSRVADVDFSQPTESTAMTYVTANENTPSITMSPSSAQSPELKPVRSTPKGYQPLKVSELTEFSVGVDMYTADEGDLEGRSENGGVHMDGPTVIGTDLAVDDPLKDDFAKLEAALQEMAIRQSDDQEIMQLMSQRRPIDTSTPVSQRTLTVPIIIEGGRVHRGTPPTHAPIPTPPSYDHVIKNYRSYSRSTSPVRLMESDL